MLLSKMLTVNLKLICAYILLAAGATAHAAESTPVNGSLQYSKHNEHNKHNKGREVKRYDTVVFSPRLHGQLKREHGEPYLVFSGLGCTECDINRSIYIHSPSDAPIENGERTARYSYPGRYFDVNSNALAERVRMFIGRCLPHAKEGVLWLMRRKEHSGAWETSYFVARVDGDQLFADYVSKESVPMNGLKKSVAEGICKELPGRDFYNEP